jgi:endonuclease/exonuclease/phosphatase family metal-dependent hydrolase
MRTLGRRHAWAAGLAGLLAAGCSLEQALGVDDGGPSTGDPTGQSGGGPGGGPGAGASSHGVDGDASDSGTGGPADDTNTGPLPAACGGRVVRVATYNVETVDAPGSVGFEALAAVLRRLDADVVCLQEVQHWETTSLFALASQAGYPDVIQAQQSPAIGGDHTNACLSRGGLALVDSYTGAELSSDAQANDVGRDILVVRVDLAEGEPAPCHVGFVALHLKAGQSPLDWFRRQIEAERVAQAVARYRDEHPDEPIVILGDLNENLDDVALGSVFTGVPEGLPPSYRVGSDIVFPLTYQPFTRFEGLGFALVPATQEDSTRDATWNDAVRLDYVLHAGAQLRGALVYNACRDDGVDGGAAGAWLPLAGDPLPCATSDDASDHFPVVADLLLP